MVIGQYAPIVGGAEVQARRLAEELAHRGHEVRVLTGRWDSASAAEETLNGVCVQRLPTLCNVLGVRGLRWMGRRWFLRALRRELVRLGGQIDILHAHQLLEPAVVAVRVAATLHKPVIAKMSSCGVTSDAGVLCLRSGRRAWHHVCTGLTRLVAVSDAVERDAREAGFPGERIVRIPNGAPATNWHKESYEGDRRIVCVSRCRPEKGVDTLIRAFGHLSRSVAGLTLDVVGGGELQGAMVVLSRTCGVPSNVVFHGDVANVLPFLKQADVFVLPSRTEGMSNALLEAMAAGLPCVATAVGGNPDLIRDGETGLLCQAEDPAGMSEAIKRLLRDESLRTRLGTAARQKVQSEYTIPQVAARYEALYAELIGERP